MPESRSLSRRRNRASMEPPCRTHDSRPPWSRCRHCTKNSMSRIPPRASLMSKPACQPLRAASFSLSPQARRRHRLDGGEVQCGRVDLGLQEFQQALAHTPVAGRHARLDEHLQLPIARAILIIVARGVERQGDLAHLPFRPQAHIHPVAAPLLGVSGEQIDAPVRQPLKELLVGDRGRPVRLAVPAVEKHQVDVGAVVQFPAAVLPQGEHRKPALLRARLRRARLAVARGEIGSQAATGHGEDGVRQVGQLFGGFRESAESLHVPDQNSQKLPAAKQR